MLSSVAVGNNLMDEVLKFVASPKHRDHFKNGFHALAEAQALTYAAFCDLHNYDRDKFFDACDKYFDELRNVSRQFELARTYQLVQQVGMSLEDFQKQMKEPTQ